MLLTPTCALGDRRTPLQRRTGLASSGPIRRTTTLNGTSRPLQAAKTAPKPVHKRDTGPSKATRALVAARDQYRCVACAVLVELAVVGGSIQHRVARKSGGRHGEIAAYLNSPVNLALLCGSGTTGCHGWVESRPAAADQKGLSVPSWADPATVPMRTRYGWVLLNPDGTKTAVEEPPGGDALAYAGVRRLEA